MSRRYIQNYYWQQQHHGLFACNKCGAEYSHQCLCLSVFSFKNEIYHGAQVLEIGLTTLDEQLVRSLLVDQNIMVDLEKLIRIA